MIELTPKGKSMRDNLTKLELIIIEATLKFHPHIKEPTPKRKKRLKETTKSSLCKVIYLIAHHLALIRLVKPGNQSRLNLNNTKHKQANNKLLPLEL